MLTNEQFYDQLACFYDAMNDWPARLAYEGPFLRQLLTEHAAVSVLDAACGTGQHTLALHDWGYQATGADASPQMVQRAQANAAARAVPVSFLVTRFSDLPAFFSSPFDAVFCLGNSLPHVGSDDELDTSLEGMARVLRPGGLLVLHNLNYDKRWVERPRFFKLDSGILDSHEVLIWRLADYGEADIAFHTALFTRDDAGKWTVQVNSTPQKPLFHADLTARLTRVGLQDIRAYGNLRGEPFDIKTSGDLVLVGTKVA